MKAGIVELDVKDSAGQRLLLNLGHTLGHALEVETGFERFLHGEAVGLGLIAAARVGASLGTAPRELEGRIRVLLSAFGLPNDISSFSSPRVFEHLPRDKKFQGDKVLFVVPVAEGGAKAMPLSVEQLQLHLWSSRRGA